jgi:oligopeptide/dipeptide ABC transporter ATP-binding protein
MPADELLRTSGLSVHFPVRRSGFGPKQVVHALDDVSLAVRPGRTLGVVGESGSGKTTLGYAVVGHHRPTAGRIWFQGTDVTGYTGARLRELRRDIQMIYQDPYGSLNPRMRIEDIVAEPLVAHERVRTRRELRLKVGELLEMCGLSPTSASRYPHAFSGGQRQRIVIARALALEPKLIVADEPTSALDVSVQAQIVNLMQSLQDRLGLSYIFVSHDLAVVRRVSHEIAVMYLGRVVELGTAERIFDAPQHPYTKALLSAIPVPDPEFGWGGRQALGGEVPSPLEPPPGCRFHTRCPIVIDRCSAELPEFAEHAPGHWAACHRIEER